MTNLYRKNFEQGLGSDCLPESLPESLPIKGNQPSYLVFGKIDCFYNQQPSTKGYIYTIDERGIPVLDGTALFIGHHKATDKEVYAAWLDGSRG